MKFAFFFFLSFSLFANSGVGSLKFDAKKMKEVESKSKVLYKMVTNHGDIMIELWPTKAPVTVKNFEQYANKKKYDGTIFHRVMKGFVLQGGGFDEKLVKRPTFEPIQNEATNGLKNDYGTLSMARTSDINSATNQFFINMKNNDMLNHNGKANYGYAVFGKVQASSFGVLKSIEGVQIQAQGMHRSVPAKPVKILKVEKL